MSEHTDIVMNSIIAEVTYITIQLIVHVLKPKSWLPLCNNIIIIALLMNKHIRPMNALILLTHRWVCELMDIIISV